MTFFVDFYENYKLPITIGIIIFIYIIIYATLLGRNLNNYIDKNWYHLKNKPYIMPFAGFFGKGKGSNIFTKTIYNVYSFFTNLFKKFISLFLKPFMYFIDLISKITENLRNTINKFRSMAQIIRNLFKQTVENTAEKISNSYSAIMYFQEKLKLIIKKMSAMFSIFKQFGNSLNFVFYSYMNGPIPRAASFMAKYAITMLVFLVMCLLCPIPFVGIIACPVCALCFDSETLIDTEVGKIKIKDLNVNDTLIGGGKITGIIKILAGESTMYLYNNVIVSGSHLVYEHYTWKRVEDSINATLIEYDKNKILYCLINENNIIISFGNKFSDYRETNDENVNYQIDKYIINFLNKGINIQTPTDTIHQYYWGFSEKTLIETSDGIKYITDITINDYINKQQVLGIVKLCGKDKILYNYKGVIVSGSQSVCEKGIWLRVHQSIYSSKHPTEDYIYHIITENSRITINNVEFCDFCETNDEKMNDEIDKMVENFKNYSEMRF